MLSKLLLAVTGIAFAAAQTIPATITKLDLAVVKAEFDASGYSLSLNRSTALNVSLSVDAGFRLNMMYGDTVIENGQPYPAGDVAAMPTVYVTTQNMETPSTLSTLMLVDLGALNNPDPEGIYIHYLANSIHPQVAQVASNANQTLVPTQGNVIVQYAGPGPLPGTGAHRYAWLMWGERANFTAPGAWSRPNTPAGHIDIKSYRSQAKLKDLQAACFFTVENAAPTFVPVLNTAINTRTVVVSSATPSTSRAIGAAAAATSSNSTTSGAASQAQLQLVGIAGMLVAVIASVSL